MTAPAFTLTDDTTAADDHAFAPGTPLKERAWALYCQGAHSPEIGRRLGISERTVRSWLNHTLNDLDAEHTALRAHELALAIARKRQLSAAAWESYSRLSAIADAECAKAADGDPTADVRLVRQALSAGARYLALANAIDRDLVRLHDACSGMSGPRPRSASPFLSREGGQGVRLEAAADNFDHRSRDHNSPANSGCVAALSPTLFDLLTPDVIARMAADGLLDDWPPSPATVADQEAPESENAAKTANSEVTAPPRVDEIDARIAHPTSSAPPLRTAQNESAAISANPLAPASVERVEDFGHSCSAQDAKNATPAISAITRGESGEDARQIAANGWGRAPKLATAGALLC